MKKYFLLLIILIVCFFLYGKYINTNSLELNENFIKTNKLSKSFDGLKIIHFSDILYDEYMDEFKIKEIVNNINKTNPDIVIFTGDLFNKGYKIKEKDIELFSKYFKKINSNYYKYAVLGDIDKKNKDDYISILNKSNFILLDNSYQYFFYKDINPIKIIGFSDTNNVDNLLVNEENIEPSYIIGLTHYSDNFKELKEYDIDLVLAGNSLAGQIRIPFMGGILNKKGSNLYIDSYYEENNSKLYVSNGIGTEKYHFRTFNSPSINLYRLSIN